MNIFDIVIKLSNNFCDIISREELKKYDKLNWGNNGIGNRWCNKMFNYTVIYNNKIKTYSENDEIIHFDNINHFRNIYGKNNGIIGILVHSKRLNIVKRNVQNKIKKEIIKKSCVSCGSNNDIICDHKNVLNIITQQLCDFQPLCNHCNLQKRQISKNEIKNNKIYSAKNLDKYKIYPFDFPWEKKYFDVKNINTKKDTYWYDPIEFNNKIYLYSLYVIPILQIVKKNITRIE